MNRRTVNPPDTVDGVLVECVPPGSAAGTGRWHRPARTGRTPRAPSLCERDRWGMTRRVL